MSTARLFRLVVLSAVWLGAANCLATEWVSVETAHFRLVSHTSADEAQQIAQQLETFRAAWEHITGHENSAPRIPATVLVFQDEAEFKPFNPYHGAGYFLAGNEENYIALPAGPERGVRRTAYHEYAHLLVGQRFPKLPLWLDEGLAEYYSSLRVDGAKIYLGGPLPGHLQTLRAEAWLPLAQLLAVDTRSPVYRTPAQRHAFYAQAWFLVHCLTTQPRQFERFLALLETGTPAPEALPQAFQMSLEELETSYRVAFTARALARRVFPLPAQFPAPDSWPALPVTEAAALACQGDLLRRLEDYPAAEAKLNQALALDGRQAHAQAVLGLLRAGQRRFAEARTLLQEASQSVPDNYLYHFYLAQTISRAALDENNRVRGYYPADAAVMRGALRRTLALAPDFAEAHALLAFVNLVQGEDLAAAEHLAQEALRFAPRRLEWRTTLARILLQRNKYGPARQALAPLLETPEETPGRDQARQILDAVSRAEANAARRAERKKGGIEAWEPTDGTEEVDVEKVAALLQDAALRRALRPVGAGEARIQGLLTELECDASGAAYLLVRAPARMYKLRAAALPQISFRAFAPGLSGPGRQITCGPRAPANPAIVTFRPFRDAKGKFDGEAIAVEFVPEKFRLEP